MVVDTGGGGKVLEDPIAHSDTNPFSISKFSIWTFKCCQQTYILYILQLLIATT